MIMGETNYTLAQDLLEARKMADSLEDYVRGDQLYGTIGAASSAEARCRA